MSVVTGSIMNSWHEQLWHAWNADSQSTDATQRAQPLALLAVTVSIASSLASQIYGSCKPRSSPAAVCTVPQVSSSMPGARVYPFM